MSRTSNHPWYCQYSKKFCGRIVDKKTLCQIKLMATKPRNNNKKARWTINNTFVSAEIQQNLHKTRFTGESRLMLKLKI